MSDSMSDALGGDGINWVELRKKLENANTATYNPSTTAPMNGGWLKDPWHCPNPTCPVKPNLEKWPYTECSLNKPLMLHIPSGQHLHLPCPVHGEHILHGPEVTL